MYSNPDFRIREIFARGTRNPGHWKISETIQIPLMTEIRNPSFADNETWILGLGSRIQDCLGFLYMGRDRRISPRETFQHPCLRWKSSSLNFRIDFLHSNMQFSTKDADNDHSPHSCAQRHSGGWWFNKCSLANPNGLYHNGPYSGQYANGAKWATFRGQFYSLKRIEMKLKPKE